MRPLFILPVAVFAVLAVAFGWQLVSGKDPSLLPSARIGKPVPDFTLPPIVGDGEGLSSEALRGEVSLVNFFASWCIPCRVEHPLLLQLQADGVVPIYGIDYKDEPAAGAKWLADLGDPFTAVGADRDGRVGLDFGVYGVPETYVVDRDGIVRYRHVGPLSARDVETIILPLIGKLNG